MSLWYAFRELDPFFQFIVMVGVSIGLQILIVVVMRHSIWLKGYKAGRASVLGEKKEVRKEKQNLDTQENIFGFMKNRLEPHFNQWPSVFRL